MQDDWKLRVCVCANRNIQPQKHIISPNMDYQPKLKMHLASLCLGEKCLKMFLWTTQQWKEISKQEQVEGDT